MEKAMIMKSLYCVGKKDQNNAVPSLLFAAVILFWALRWFNSFCRHGEGKIDLSTTYLHHVMG